MDEIRGILCGYEVALIAGDLVAECHGADHHAIPCSDDFIVRCGAHSLLSRFK